MKAVVFHEFGGLDVLRVEDVPDPEPAPGEVVIDITASALNHLDVDIREGISRFPVEPPFILGVEPAGRIAEVGDGVEGWQAGDRVLPYLMDTCGGCRYCKTGRESLCFSPGFISFSTGGAYAEKLACSARHLIRIPEGLSDEQAAATQIAFATSWHMLFARGRLQPGEIVMINSVGSGIGSAAVQLAKMSGAFVIGNASSQEKLDHAASLGMDVGIDYTKQDVVEEVMRVTDGMGVDLVYEHVGGRASSSGSTRCPRTAASSSAAATRARSCPSTSSPSSAARSRSSAPSSSRVRRSSRRSTWQPRGKITPLVHATFPLDQARDAMEMMERREHFGKIVLTP